MRGIAGPIGDDAARCHRDGTACVIDSPDSDIYRCPECNAVTVLEPFETREYRCGGCERRFQESYFPLVDRTLLHLERTHPRRGLEVIREIDAANRARALSQCGDLRTHAEACASDRWREVSGGVMVGYTKRGTPHAYGS